MLFIYYSPSSCRFLHIVNMSDSKRICTRQTNECQVAMQSQKSDQNMYCTTKSLLNICIEYIAGHTHYVDSFCDFPDIIGEKIFKTAVTLGKFTRDNPKLETAIAPFCDAYDSSILTSLSLVCQHLVLNNYLDTIFLFKDIRALDISSCCLGDNHEMLHHISHLSRLETLCMRGNILSNEGLRKLTAPIRMFQHASSLKHLDISENQITEKGIMYLGCFPNIKIVNISSNKIKNFSSLKVKGLHYVSTDKDDFADVFKISTKGWAEPVVSLWCKEQENTLNKKRVKKSSFYKYDVVEESHTPLQAGLPKYTHMLLADCCLSATVSPKTFHNKNNKIEIPPTSATQKHHKVNPPTTGTEIRPKHALGDIRKTGVDSVSSDEDDLMKMYSGQCQSSKVQNLSDFLTDVW